MLRRYIVRLLCVYLVALLAVSRAVAADVLPDKLSDSAKMSILVVEPSSEAIYTLYGHAGFRVRDLNSELDVVFNYGLFLFDDTFLLHFIKGQTDYFGAPEYTQHFINGYTYRGSNVRELLLGLSPEVQGRLWELLVESVELEKREYRYNFFRDNCATRPVSMLLRALKEVKPEATIYYDREPAGTWRSQINLLEQRYPWVLLGTDLALGAPTDEPISTEEAIFLPHNIEFFLEGLSWSMDGNRDNAAFVLDSVELYPSVSTDASLSVVGGLEDILHPYIVFTLVLLLVFLAVWKGRGLYRIVESSLFLLAGLSGALLFYISVLSEHPSVWVNYNLIVLHPLHLLLFVLLMLRARRWAYCYHFANFASQAIFLVVGYFLPQSFNPVVYMISIGLLGLSLGTILRSREK